MVRSDGSEAAGEAGLLAAAGRGDQRAAAVLYDTYADALFGYGIQRLGDRQLAEELVQLVLEKLWRHAERYDPDRGPVRGLVFAIAASTATDLHRARSRAQPPAAVAAERVAVDDAADRVIVAAGVRTALDRLTPEHRRVLELAYDRGLTQREIAFVLELPVGTVKSRSYYALKALRLACEELGVTP